MNDQLQTQLDNFKSDLRAIIACEGVTDLPWDTLGIEHSNNLRLFSRHQYIGMIGGSDQSRGTINTNGDFIARSRTITPLMAKMLLDQVEWLGKLINQNKVDISSGIHATLVTLLILQSEDYEEQLTTMLATWKEGK